ncbi:hypothetical protein EXE42_15250 [Halorubrum sp. SP3]|uniref:hypothetical protein n=1 Tax=Halorubrum sp. SP3 TaxID=1537265 RepID=UPI0010F7A2AE|nr:hypothetical protein [Halorubrum sp. SP3]TKX52836.1 hypothetical protein EXE42_15250 [Halorubrum sp. SP3]
MPANDADFDITSNSDLRAAVRDETQYSESHISEEDLSGLVDSGKRVLALRADVSDFYGDRGLAVALLGIVCAKAKGAVENSPVRVDNVGPNDVTFRTSDGSSLQLGQYEEMTQLGLSEASAVDDAIQGIEFTTPTAQTALIDGIRNPC